MTRLDELVGAAGEFMVYKALKVMTDNRVRASAWKSTNRAHFLDDGLEENNMLGYDFAFQHGGQRYEVEVKSTRTKQPNQVHLGPTEVRRASQVAKGRSKTRWQIWLVADALTNPQIHVLGNPYGPEQEGAVTEIPQGSLLRFKLVKR